MTADYRSYIAAPGLTVYDPLDGLTLPHEGEGKRVRVTSYWIRREAEGSAIVVPDAEPEAKSDVSSDDTSPAATDTKAPDAPTKKPRKNEES